MYVYTYYTVLEWAWVAELGQTNMVLLNMTGPVGENKQALRVNDAACHNSPVI